MSRTKPFLLLVFTGTVVVTTDVGVDGFTEHTLKRTEEVGWRLPGAMCAFASWAVPAAVRLGLCDLPCELSSSCSCQPGAVACLALQPPPATAGLHLCSAGLRWKCTVLPLTHEWGTPLGLQGKDAVTDKLNSLRCRSATGQSLRYWLDLMVQD